MNKFLLIADFLGIGSWINDMFHKILLLIDGVIYWAVSQTYQIFIRLANARVFQDEFFSNFAKRIYAILGVIMLFYLAYALLMAIVDPDKVTQGDKALTKIAKNIVISLVILGLLPTLFDYAYRIQGIIFKENVIGALVFGMGGNTNDASIDEYGNYMAFTALNPFLNPANYNVTLDDGYSYYDAKADLIEDGDFVRVLPVMSQWAIEPQDLISVTDAQEEGEDLEVGDAVNLGYKPVISTFCGVALLYIILSFCLDLGVRVVKFAFCQLIAPIPVIFRIMPDKKSVFDKWLKLTLSVYFEVFLRVGVMYLVIYFFSAIADADMFKYAYMDSAGTYHVNGVQATIVLVIILMGLLVFAKQAPKLIGEIFGINSGNMNLGIRDKLKAGGFFAAGSIVGAGATMGVQALTRGTGATINAARNVPNNLRLANAYRQAGRDARQDYYRGHWSDAIHNYGQAARTAFGAFGSVASTAARTVGSVAVSTVEGGATTAPNAVKNNNMRDMANTAREGVNQTRQHQAQRVAYRASHPGFLGPTRGHVSNIARGVSNWAGIRTDMDALRHSQSTINELFGIRTEIDNRADKLFNVEKRTRQIKFEYVDAAGNKKVEMRNYAILEEELANARRGGPTATFTNARGQTVNATAENINQMEIDLAAMKKQAKADIINGISTDGVNKVDPSKYDAELQIQVGKLMSATRANSPAIRNNVVSKKNEATRAIEFSNQHFNDNIGELMTRTNINDFVLDSHNSLREANNNLNMQISRVYQQQNQGNKKN